LPETLKLSSKQIAPQLPEESTCLPELFPDPE
jgi:hypothetical protein